MPRRRERLASLSPLIPAVTRPDFDAGDGQQVLASVLFEAGDRGRRNNGNRGRAWYGTDTPDWHASGELLDGSLAWNGTTVNQGSTSRIRAFLRLNDARHGFDLGDSFEEGAQPGSDHLGPAGDGEAVVRVEGSHREPRRALDQLRGAGLRKGGAEQLASDRIVDHQQLSSRSLRWRARRGPPMAEQGGAVGAGTVVEPATV